MHINDGNIICLAWDEFDIGEPFIDHRPKGSEFGGSVYYDHWEWIAIDEMPSDDREPIGQEYSIDDPEAEGALESYRNSTEEISVWCRSLGDGYAEILLAQIGENTIYKKEGGHGAPVTP